MFWTNQLNEWFDDSFIKAVTEMVYIIIYYNIKIFAFGKEGDVGVDIVSVTLETEG